VAEPAARTEPSETAKPAAPADPTDPIAPPAEETEKERYYRPNQSPYKVWPAVEIPVAIGSAVVFGVPRLFVDELVSPWCGLDCDPDKVNALDRLVIGHGNQTAADASDYLFWSAMGLPFAFDLIDVAVSKPHDGWRGYGADFLVLWETLSITMYVNTMVSFMVRRPRPYVYNDSNSDEMRLSGEAAMSFYSGHAAVSFACATAYSRLFMKRHPQSPLVAPVWVFTYGLAASVGTLRVVGGAHFPTDVIVGSVAGVGLGLLIPWLHELPVDQRQAPRRKRSSLRLRPYFAGTSIGLMGAWR
jgi:membrane-associated phospholipid phosphatase